MTGSTTEPTTLRQAEVDVRVGGRVRELDFTEGDGATTVVLTHRGLESEESRDGHADGWRQALDNLGAVVQS